MKVRNSELLVQWTSEDQFNDDPKMAKRMKAVEMACQGLTCPLIARELNVSERSVTYWITRFNEKGVDGLKHIQGAGRKSRITKEQMIELGQLLSAQDKKLNMGQSQKIRFLSRVLLESYGVTYSQARLYDLLHRLELQR